MSDRTPEQAADAVILEALRGNVQLFVALSFRGLIDNKKLMARFGDELVSPDAPPAPLLPNARERSHQMRTSLMPREWPKGWAPSDPPAPVATRSRQTLLFRDLKPPRKRMKKKQSELFVNWIEGRIPFSPEVLGWEADDARAKGWQDGRFD